MSSSVAVDIGRSYAIAVVAGGVIAAFADLTLRPQAQLWCWASVFALVGLTAWRMASLGREGDGDPDGRLRLVEGSHGLARVALWAGVAMGVGYLLTPLDWYHAYQYALLFILVSGGVFAFAQWLGRGPGLPGGRSTLVALAAFQTLGAGVGLAFLYQSGKLELARADWLANAIFLAAASGGLALGLLSLLTLWQTRPR